MRPDRVNEAYVALMRHTDGFDEARPEIRLAGNVMIIAVMISSVAVATLLSPRRRSRRRSRLRFR